MSATSFKDNPKTEDTDIGFEEANTIETASPQTIPENDHSIEDKGLLPDLETWKEKIDTLMQVQKMYEDPALVIADISQQLGTHSKKISQVVNQGYLMNFNDFVNHHRIKALLQKMEEGEHNIQTLLSLAYECGFNSKSTFNRAFKRATSLNPKEYIEKHFPK